MTHKRYGEGIVLKTRYAGAQLLVKFSEGLTRWVNNYDLNYSSFLNRAFTKIKADEDSSISDDRKEVDIEQYSQKYIARRILESLRMGIFPEDLIESFTFGRDKERESIKNNLEISDNGSFIISGEYGAGKTHFLEYLKQVLIRDNWAVSLIQFDSNAIPLNRPKALYEEIINCFKYNHGDFKKFLTDIANNSRAFLLNDHKYLGEMVRRIKIGHDHPHCWRWIQGKLESAGTQVNLPPIYTYSTAANIFSYIISGIGYAAKEILDLNGFVILFDEAENIDPYWYSVYQIGKGWNFLKGLILMSNNSEILFKEPIEKRDIANKVSPEHWGKHTNLQYYNRYECRYIWKIPTSVKLIFAFTPDKSLFNRKPLRSLEVFELNSLDQEAHQEIATKISNLYLEAYNFKTDKSVSSKYFENEMLFDSTRMYIKSLVEILDLIRFHPEKSIKTLLRR